MITIDAMVEDDGWSSIEPESLCATCAKAVSDALGEEAPDGSAAILLTSDEAVQHLNRDFRSKDRPTNVLSFPADDTGLPPGADPFLGDIAIAAGVALREATEKGISFSDHTAHLIVHGLLHLIGYDHIVDADAEIMEALERDILQRLDIADPYV